MKFEIKSHIKQDYEFVDKHLTKDFLLLVNPKIPPFKITRFDGEKIGDLVHVELNFFLFKEKWEYEIKDHTLNDKEWKFVDQSIKHPFFFNYWSHQFRMENLEGEIVISDIVNYNTPFFLLDYFLFPGLYLFFNYRKSIYKKMYGKVKK